MNSAAYRQLFSESPQLCLLEELKEKQVVFYNCKLGYMLRIPWREMQANQVLLGASATCEM